MVALFQRAGRHLIIASLLLLLVPMQPAQAYEISADPFAQHYWLHNGSMVLGRVNTTVMEIDGYRMQYFEKGRLEDHSHEATSPQDVVVHSRLTLEMIERAPDIPIDGLPVTYGELRSRGEQMHAPPPGFAGGTLASPDGVFIPADPNLGVVPGYVVPHQIWTYMNREYLYPGGWMRNFGLPLTNAFHVAIEGDGMRSSIIVQAFERAVLTLDLSQHYDWQVQRANIGTDAVWISGNVPMFAPHAPPPPTESGPKRIEVDLGRQWLYAYEGNRLVMDVPVSTGKDGFNTPPGSFRIYSKIAQKTLRGTQNGETWNVPDVPSVMFYRGGFAIHGVYWHDRFGTGERYSHGCVGVAPYDAAALFAWAPMGTPVIVR